MSLLSTVHDSVKLIFGTLVKLVIKIEFSLRVSIDPLRVWDWHCTTDIAHLQRTCTCTITIKVSYSTATRPLASQIQSVRPSRDVVGLWTRRLTIIEAIGVSLERLNILFSEQVSLMSVAPDSPKCVGKLGVVATKPRRNAGPTRGDIGLPAGSCLTSSFSLLYINFLT